MSSDGNLIAVGAVNNDGGGSDAGHVRVYDFCIQTSGVDIRSACDSYTWIDGNTYTASNNTATYTLTNAAGCDSIVTLDLTINSATVDAGNPQTICFGCGDIPDDSATFVATGAKSYFWTMALSMALHFYH